MFFVQVIARRRIQHSSEFIGSLIDQCDLVELPPEHAELLLKFVPTKKEVSDTYTNICCLCAIKRQKAASSENVVVICVFI